MNAYEKYINEPSKCKLEGFYKNMIIQNVQMQKLANDEEKALFKEHNGLAYSEYCEEHFEFPYSELPKVSVAMLNQFMGIHQILSSIYLKHVNVLHDYEKYALIFAQGLCLVLCDAVKPEEALKFPTGELTAYKDYIAQPPKCELELFFKNWLIRKSEMQEAAIDDEKALFKEQKVLDFSEYSKEMLVFPQSEVSKVSMAMIFECISVRRVMFNVYSMYFKALHDYEKYALEYIQRLCILIESTRLSDDED